SGSVGTQAGSLQIHRPGPVLDDSTPVRIRAIPCRTLGSAQCLSRRTHSSQRGCPLSHPVPFNEPDDARVAVALSGGLAKAPLPFIQFRALGHLTGGSPARPVQQFVDPGRTRPARSPSAPPPASPPRAGTPSTSGAAPPPPPAGE